MGGLYAMLRGGRAATIATPVAHNLFDLSGRTAVVVGGTTGIGRAIAIGLAQAGADVVATGRRLSAVETAADQIQAQGRRTLRMAADVGNAASLCALRDAVLSTFTTV